MCKNLQTPLERRNLRNLVEFQLPGTVVDVTHLKVKVGFCEVLVQSRRQVLGRGQDDAAHTDSCYTLHANAVSDELSGRILSVLLAGEEPHDVPVAGENTELHQVSEHAQNLQQELLKREKSKTSFITYMLCLCGTIRPLFTSQRQKSRILTKTKSCWSVLVLTCSCMFVTCQTKEHLSVCLIWSKLAVPWAPLCSESSPSGVGSGYLSSGGGGTGGRTHTLPANSKAGGTACEPITRWTIRDDDSGMRRARSQTDSLRGVWNLPTWMLTWPVVSRNSQHIL